MKNTTKHLLQEGKQTCGLWLTSGSDTVAEAMAQVGFDWLCIDTEHGNGDFRETRAQLQGIGTSATTPIIRPAVNDFTAIKKMLDLGAQGLVLPWVNSREEAEYAVRACQYPPDGIRGFAGQIRADRFGADPAYLHTANAELLIAVQIETREAVQNIEEIVKVPGVDVIFIGPWDLSFSLGCPLDFEHPDHRAAMQRVEKTAKAAGKVLGTVTSDLRDLAKYYERGYQFVAIGVEMGLLLNAARTQLQRVKEE
jgi:2-keto-3-deoxy-L-rhamnonate aldolase RhmA